MLPLGVDPLNRDQSKSSVAMLFQPHVPSSKLHLASGIRIFAPETTTAVDAENVVGYREVHGSVGATRKFRTTVFGDSIIHAAQAFRVRFDDPFSYNVTAPPAGFESVLIPMFIISYSVNSKP